MKSMHLFAVFAVLLPLGSADAAAFDAWQDPARYEITYEVDLTAMPEGPWRLWLPTPNMSYDQHEIAARVDAPLPHRVTWDDRGNRMLYFEGTGPAEGPIAAFFDMVREPSAGLPKGEIVRDSPDDPKRHLEPQKKIPLDGVIADLGRHATKGRTGERDKIRGIYEYVVGTMRYAKEGEGWGNGDAVWACTSKYGNCTDFHSVFLGMSRSQGVPARFVMGFPFPTDASEGVVPGYHCWAQAFEPEQGWIPLDASEAWKRKQTDAYFGKVPSDRLAFTIGRDLVLSPPQDGAPLNYFIHPYVERGGAAVEPPPWKLRFKRIPMRRTARSE